MNTVLVLGESGQVARELGGLALGDMSLVFRGRREFDLTHGAALGGLIDQIAPAAVINAAAYTAVDKAESEPEIAFALNRDAPGELAALLAARDIPLVHFSTDYVFDGSKDGPYLETDPKSPTNVYGRSKAEGEDAIEAAGGRHAILRTSWVYSAHGSNFVKTMLRLAETLDEVRVVADQQGKPTWAHEAAIAAVLAARTLIEGEDLGVLHVAGAGETTWAVFAQEIFRMWADKGRRTPKVVPIPASEYPTAARRPANSRLDTTRAETVLAWRPRPWRYGLAECLDEIERGQ